MIPMVVDIALLLPVEQLSKEDRTRLGSVVQQTIALQVLGRFAAILDQERADELYRIFNEGTEEELHLFLKVHVMNYDDIIRQELTLVLGRARSAVR